MNEESERRGLSGVLIFCKDAKIVEICRNTRKSGLKKRKKADYILLCFHRMFYNRAKGGEKMESVILFVYVFTIPLITASLVILLIYRKKTNFLKNWNILSEHCCSRPYCICFCFTSI